MIYPFKLSTCLKVDDYKTQRRRETKRTKEKQLAESSRGVKLSSLSTEQREYHYLLNWFRLCRFEICDNRRSKILERRPSTRHTFRFFRFSRMNILFSLLSSLFPLSLLSLSRSSTFSLLFLLLFPFR